MCFIFLPLETIAAAIKIRVVDEEKMWPGHCQKGHLILKNNFAAYHLKVLFQNKVENRGETG